MVWVASTLTLMLTGEHVFDGGSLIFGFPLLWNLTSISVFPLLSMM